MIQKTEIISLREFGRRMNVSDKTIRDSIKTHKIVKGLTSKNGKPKIVYEIAKIEFEQMNVGAKAKYGIEDEEIVPGVPKSQEDDAEFLDGDASIALAQRMKAIAEANIKLREDALLAKTLVKVDDIKIQLCELASSLRIEFETLPNRSAGKIYAANGDINKITEILAKEVRASLLRVNNLCSSNKVLQDEN